MRVPKQFYFKAKNSSTTNLAADDNYFSFNAATEEAKEEAGQ